MARAKEIKVGKGTAFLSGFNKEEVEQLTTYLSKFVYTKDNSAGALEGPEEDQVEFVQPVDVSMLVDKAIGCRLDSVSNKYQLVTVGYNAVTKEAKVENVDVCDGKTDTTSRFVMSATKLKFV